MSPFTLHEATTYSSFTLLVPCIWTAHYHPYQPYFSAYNPVFGPTHADFLEAQRASGERYWAAHLADQPASRWIYIQDEENGMVVGCCQWRFHAVSPYRQTKDHRRGESIAIAAATSVASTETSDKEKAKLEDDDRKGMPYSATMWPEGTTGREFTTMMQQKQYAHRRRWLDRPHAVCHTMSVLPNYRRRGIGAMMMDWGMGVARDMELQVFLHATREGRWLYEHSGLRVVMKVDIDMEVKNPSDEWEKLRHELGPLRFFLMWKPKDGLYVEGETPLPWERHGSE